MAEKQSAEREPKSARVPQSDGQESDRDSRSPGPAHRPVPGVKHVPEPDAENIMPAENEPGTL